MQQHAADTAALGIDVYFAGSTGGAYAQAAGRSAIWGPGGVLVAQAGIEAGALARARLL